MPFSIRRPGPSADPGPSVTDRGRRGRDGVQTCWGFPTTRLGRVAQPLGRRARRCVRGVTSLLDDAAAHDLLRRAGVAAAVIPEILAARPERGPRRGRSSRMAPRAGDSVVTLLWPPPASGASATQRWLQLWAIIAAVLRRPRAQRRAASTTASLAHPRGHRHPSTGTSARTAAPASTGPSGCASTCARADLPARSPPVQPHVHHVRPRDPTPRSGSATPRSGCTSPRGRRSTRRRATTRSVAPAASSPSTSPARRTRSPPAHRGSSTSNSPRWSVLTATSCASSAASPRSRAGRSGRRGRPPLRLRQPARGPRRFTPRTTLERAMVGHPRAGRHFATGSAGSASQRDGVTPTPPRPAPARPPGRARPPSRGSSPSSSKRVDDNARCAAALLSPTASSASARPSTTSACATRSSVASAREQLAEPGVDGLVVAATGGQQVPRPAWPRADRGSSTARRPRPGSRPRRRRPRGQRPRA